MSQATVIKSAAKAALGSSLLIFLLLSASLHAVPPERDPAPLIKQLSDTDRRVRVHAAMELCKMGTAAAPAAPALVGLLGDRSCHKQATEVLVKIGPAVVPALMKLLRAGFKASDGYCYFFDNLRSMGVEKKKALVDALARELIGDLDGGSVEHRINAMKSFSYMQYTASSRAHFLPRMEEVVAALCRGLVDEEVKVREAAADNLHTMKPASAEAVDALIAALADAGVSVRSKAARALGAVCSPRQEDKKKKEKEQPGPGRAEIERTVKALAVAAEKDAKYNARIAAMRALAKIGPDAVGAVPALTRLLESKEVAFRYEAVVTLAAIGRASTPAAGKLEKLLGEPKISAYYPVAVKAACALAKCEPEVSRKVVPAIMAWLREGKMPGRKQSLVIALGDVGPPARRAAPLLAGIAANDKGKLVRGYAARSLGKIGVGGEEVVRALIKGLQDDRWCVLPMAITALGEIGPAAKGAAPALFEVATKDKERDKRKLAVKALARMAEGDEEIIRGIFNTALVDKWLYQEVEKAMISLGLPAFKVLAEALDDPDKLVRNKAARIIWDREMKPDAAMLPAMLKALANDDETVRKAASSMLAKIGAPAVPGILEYIRSENEKDRLLPAALALARMGERDRSVVTVLVRAFRGREQKLRQMVAHIMFYELPRDHRMDYKCVEATLIYVWAFSGPGTVLPGQARKMVRDFGAAAVPYLLEGLEEDNPPYVRLEAADLLVENGVHQKEAAAAVLKVLEQSDDRGKFRKMERIMKRIGAPAVPYLVKGLSARHPRAITCAAGALCEIGPTGGKDLEEIWQAFLRADDGCAALIVRALVIYRERAVAMLAEALEHPSAQVRREVFGALEGMKPGPSMDGLVPSLSRLLSSQDEYGVSSSAAHLLLRMGEKGVEALLAAVEGGSPEASRFASHAMRNMGKEHAQAVPVLRRFLRKGSDGTKVAAAEALGRIGPGAGKAVPELQALLEHGNPMLRRTGIKALTGIGVSPAQAFPAVARVLGDEDAQVRAEARKLMDSLDYQDVRALDGLVEVFRNPNERMRSFAYTRLVLCGPLAAERLAKLLKKGDRALKIRTLELLTEMGAEARGAEKAVRRALKDKDEGVRRAARETLAALGVAADTKRK